MQYIRWVKDEKHFKAKNERLYEPETLLCKGFLREDLDMNNGEHVKLMWEMGSDANMQAGKFCAETIGDKITCIERASLSYLLH